jgi:hypothetical protein
MLAVSEQLHVDPAMVTFSTLDRDDFGWNHPKS